MNADTIIHNAKITTLDRSNPVASAVAIKDGKFLAVGSDKEVLAVADSKTKVIDLKGRSILPGLIDNHIHIIRGGLNFNMELRWDGVRSLADAMNMLKRQVAVTPPPQWVRVVGGFTEHQFTEKRLPTIEEINAIAPDTPVFLLHLYDRALLNAAAMRAVGYTKDTPEPPGGEITRDVNGNPTGLLLAKPNANILYATLAKGPKLSFEHQVNSTRHFMRELNRLGVTGAIDAGGGYQNYPEDYAVIQKLSDENHLTVRLAYNLYPQKPKQEKEDFLNWASSVKYKQGNDYFRHNGAGENLVFSAADFEDFRQPRPDLPAEMEGEMEEVVRILAENRWPWRLHATYDESISRALDVFEKVNKDIPFKTSVGALCQAKKDGFAKHVGVANFTTKMLDDAWAATSEPLVCNQIEMHPFINQDKVLATSKKHGMAVVAYCPIARGKVPGADALERIGKAHGKSAAQVSLRYLVQMGVCAIPRSDKPDHLKANLDVFDFKLTDAEMAELKKLNDTNMRVVNPPHAPVWDTP